MTALDLDRLVRENDYLKLRCAQLQGDVTDLGGQVVRLQEALERLNGRRPAAPGVLSGGQS